MNPIKVVYIAGSGRCGSTLLSMLLGQTDGYIDCGELRYFWERGLVENRKCGCGVPISDCLFWEGVVNQMSSTRNSLSALCMAKETFELTRYRNFSTLGKNGFELPENYVDTLRSLYQGIHNQSGGKILIDSSKHPPYARLLTKVPGIEIFFVHLVRDPRSVVYSWNRKKGYEPNSAVMMDRFGTLHASLICRAAYDTASTVVSNLPHVVVKYEDLVSDPNHELAKLVCQIGRWSGVSTNTSRWVDQDMEIEGELSSRHTVAGNPMRFGKKICVKSDVAWITKMSWFDKFLSSQICAPEMKSCNYR